MAPGVLGLPLASPWRRAGAIAIDGALCAILANAPGVLFGLAAAYVLFRVSGRARPGAGYLSRTFRLLFRVGGAFVLFLAAIGTWDSIRDRISANEERQASPGVEVSIQREGEEVATGLNLSGMQAVQFGTGVVSLRTAENEDEARRAVIGLLERLRAAGMSGSEARAAVRDLAGDVESKPWLAAAVEGVLTEDAETDEEAGEVAPDSTEAQNSLVAAYAAAIAADDSATADSLRPSMVALLARDTVAVLSREMASVESERNDLRARVNELEEELEEGPGIVTLIRGFIEDLGLGLGWFGLYFTATTAMWHGTTPGKRLFGIRVISLTGRPIGWWASFERFGGYAAGFATGLLGFLQILWDDNRQAIHDKIAATVVVRD